MILSRGNFTLATLLLMLALVLGLLTTIIQKTVWSFGMHPFQKTAVAGPLCPVPDQDGIVFVGCGGLF